MLLRKENNLNFYDVTEVSQYLLTFFPSIYLFTYLFYLCTISICFLVFRIGQAKKKKKNFQNTIWYHLKLGYWN